MKRINFLHPIRAKLLLASLGMAAVTITCGVLEVKIEKTPQTAPPTNPAAILPTPDPSSDQQTIPKPLAPDPVGPWLVFVIGNLGSPAQIWTANPDGSGMIVLADDAYVQGYRGNYLMPAISSNGQYLAYIEVREQPIRAFLHVINLETGENKIIVQLYDESEIGYSQEKLDVILYQASSLAWSPDGRALAFIGAMEGESADLYLHLPEESSVTRLSDGPGQAYMPVWSQDGKTILYTATSEFHRGEGFSPFMFTPDGLWALDLDTYTNKPIAWPFGEDPEFIKYAPWYGSTFTFFGNGAPCEDANGCWLDVLSGETGSFPFSIVKFAVSPENGGLLATSFNSTQPIDTAGAYLFTLESPGGTRLFESELESIQWLEQAGIFAAQVTTQPQLVALQINADGTIIETDQWPGSSQYVEMAASPDGQRTAWYRFIEEFETGLWLGSDQTQPLKQVHAGPVHDAIWTPDSQGLFFTVDEFNPPPLDNSQGLYRTDRDGSGKEFLFSIPPENYIVMLGFAGN